MGTPHDQGMGMGRREPSTYRDEPSAAERLAVVNEAIARALDRQADALGRLADVVERLADHQEQLVAVVGFVEDLGQKVDEVIATLNSGIDVNVQGEQLEPVAAIAGGAPELHIMIHDPDQIPMILEAWRSAQEAGS